MHIERLAAHHDVLRFESGVKALDDWLRDHAMANQDRDLSRTFVLVDDNDLVGPIVGFYWLTMGGVSRTDLPKGYRHGLPDVSIGMALLGRLAIAASRQEEGLGRDLLVAAIEHAASASRHVAARFIAVDPIDDSARDFYRHFGFRDVPGDLQGRMFLRIDHALGALGLDG
jgi:GNAT superfamily N-acetyltransferase